MKTTAALISFNTNGYFYLKEFKFVDTSPTNAVYNNPGGLCGFLVERPVRYYFFIDIFFNNYIFKDDYYNLRGEKQYRRECQDSMVKSV